MIKTIKLMRATLKTIKSIEELSKKLEKEKSDFLFLALFLAVKRLEFQYFSLPIIIQLILSPYVMAKVSKVDSLLNK